MVQELSVVLQIGLITSEDHMTCNYQYLWISIYLELSNWEKELSRHWYWKRYGKTFEEFVYDLKCTS